MNISAQQQGKLWVITIQGRLDTIGAPEFDREMAQYLEQPAEGYLLDLSGMEYISSAGLRSLLVVAKRLGNTGQKLVLCGLNELANEVFDISGFKTLFTICQDREQGLAQMA